MKPYVILHNSISLDGALIHFDVNMSLHYDIVGRYNPDAHLIGSHTIREGIQRYGTPSKECEADFQKPKRDTNHPYWFVIDSTGRLKGLLHNVRRYDLFKDLIVLISEKTHQSYVDYLDKRDYTYHILGKKTVNIEHALPFIAQQYQVKTIITDTGRILGNLLLEKGFISEISLLIHPVVVGEKGYYMFHDIEDTIKLQLKKSILLEDHYLWVTYTIDS